MSEIKNEFLNALSIALLTRTESLWNEIEACYSEGGRHYHTLAHLEHVLHELLPHKNSFNDWNTLIFALVYHDVVYNPLKSDNEEKSAALAAKQLSELSVNESQINRCRQFILATKKHEPADAETNLFTDADLSILGAEANRYDRYTKQVRKEYGLFPDFIYSPGRKKVLNHFLAMSRIYKTDTFYNRYEKQARTNLQAERDALNG